MADPDQLALLKKCSEALDITEWNNWLKERQAAESGFRPDLVEANLRRAHLRRADLTRAILLGANLGEADLGEANLSVTNISRADLIRAYLFGAYLFGADLSRADLGGANLFGADLHGTLLGGANLDGAILNQTHFANVDLSQVKGLDTVKHDGPSTIGIDTLYASGGNIPEVFLRGCGVPDTMITFARSLVGKAIEFYSAFISYSSKDEEFVRRLHADLQAKGVRVWFAPEDLEIGQPIIAGIDAAIRSYDKLMVILSENSIHSEWVNFEVTNAIDRERKQKRRTLFPIRIDNNVLRLNEALAHDTDPERHEQYSWVNQVCQRHIGDFTHWKEHDEYQKAFARLLRDLQAAQAPATGE
ncbi:MAG: toll/interleukin-1 receptor domain-containing protein [Anaerolineae bacterium]